MRPIQPVVLASDDRYFTEYGMSRGSVHPFEDGMRTDGSPGSYEWWYFDALLDDGTKMVVAFYTKDFVTPGSPMKPLVTIDLDLLDGRSLHRRATFDAASFAASRERCDVGIADNRFVGDLTEYRITATVEDVSVDLTLRSRCEPWRPQTGRLLYGDREDKYFAWLPSVPVGDVTATYRVEGEEHRGVRGTGYHDHNWGNTSLLPLINNWYWGRGSLGPFTFISAYIVCEKQYGYLASPVFMLARDGVVIAGDGDKVTFSKDGIEHDEVTGKPVANEVRFEYRDGPTRYVLTYNREETILRSKLADLAPRSRRMLAKLAGFDGAYLRFSGSLEIEHFEHDERVEHFEGDALWELMYFGRHAHEE